MKINTVICLIGAAALALLVYLVIVLLKGDNM